MSAATNQFDRWLSQGYIDAEGFSPASDHQSAVSEKHGLSLGTSGSGRGVPGGGGLPFSREAPGGREFTPDTWKVDSAEDILRYLEFAQEMAPHATSKQEAFNIPNYTGQDIYDYFTKPQELALMQAQRAGTQTGLERGRRIAGSEGAKIGDAIDAPGDFKAVSQRALASRGGPFAERALIEGLKGMSSGINQDPTRMRPLNKLVTAAQTGHGVHADLNDTISNAFGALDMGGGGDAASSIVGGASKLLTAPFQMGGMDQARRHREVLARKMIDLGNVDPVQWGTDMPVAGSTPQQQMAATSLEESLGEVFPTDAKKKKKQGDDSFAFT